MTSDELADLVKASIDSKMTCKPGSVLFSGVATIKRSRFYIMGLNPGGNSNELNNSILDFLAPLDGASPYTHECWNRACGNDPRCDHKRRAERTGGCLAEEDLVKHQKNVIRIAKMLGCMPAELPSANAIFARSRSLNSLARESGFGVWDWWSACWPVHLHLLDIVRPEVIITFGYGRQTSPFGFLARELSAHGPSLIEESAPREGKIMEVMIPLPTSLLPVRVIGVPHPSWHAPGPKLCSLFRNL